MPRIIVPLDQIEYDALLLVSQAERRDPRDQVGLWMRRALEDAGVLVPVMEPARGLKFTPEVNT